MENRYSRPGALGFIAAIAALALALCVLACPVTAAADETKPVAHSYDASGGATSYLSIEEALAEGYDGKTIYMDADWVVKGLTIEEGKKLEIDMYGHKIACSDSNASSVINIGKGAQLTLTSSKKHEFWYQHFSGLDGSASYTLTDTGGLVTNNSQDPDDIRFTGIEVGENATLSLDGVTIAGCYGDDRDDDNIPGGGVTMRRTSTLNMVNGATIEGNKARMHGAGVYVAGSDSTINIDNSSISRNYADTNGGGICISGYRVNVNMSNDAHIDNNGAEAGGGLFCFSASCTLKSKDGKASVSGNRALSSSTTTVKWNQSGGGIHISGTLEKNPNVLIENITIADNYSAYDGGGLELDYKGVTIRNCTIKGNTCKYEGGGIYVCDNGETIDGCTITGNACSVDSGGNYEGGGVFVWHSYDINMTGKCIIKGNTRGKDSGNADDVMLRENAGATAKAYITGSLAEGSSVGVRTGTTGDRRIAKNFKPESKDCLFYDMDGYYVSYGTDEGGDAWQRHTTKEFAARIDGETKARYKNGSTATLVAPTFKDNRIFWRWDKDRTYGLYPFDDYFSGSALTSNVFNFTMPQNDVGLGTYYTTRAEAVKVCIDAPVAGEALPPTAKVQRDDNGIGGYGWATASVTWYEVDGDKKTQVSGTAKPGTVYAATVSCAVDPSIPLYFESSINWGNVRVATDDSSKGSYPVSASVDSVTGALTVVTGNFETAGDKAEETDGALTVKTVNGGLAAGVGGSTQSEAASVAALSDDEGGARDAREPLSDPVEVAFASGSESVAIAAPAVDGYNFNHWEGVPDGVEYDDTDGCVTILASKLADGLELTAVYAPAVTRVEVEMDEPAPAAGAKLATSVGHLVLTGYDNSTLDLVEEIGEGERPVSWSPASEDGLADYSTAYTALVELSDGEDLEDVEEVLAQGAEVVVTAASGVTEAEVEGSGFTVVDGKLCLAITFPATRDAKVASVSQPADVELTFEQAKACAELGIWPLSSSVDVAVESGVATEGDVKWQDVEGFDADAAGTQELTAHGAVTRIATADGSEIDESGATLDVACTIKVAAPSQDGGNGAAGSGPDEANKSALAKTGDSIPAFAVAAVAVVAIAAVVVAIVAALRRKRG